MRLPIAAVLATSMAVWHGSVLQPAIGVSIALHSRQSAPKLRMGEHC
jgi:hypothetical protein